VATTEGRIRAISVSSQKGEPKHNVPAAELRADFGIVGDAHAGGGPRQVSLLAMESIEELRGQGADISPGDFAENVTAEGLDLSALAVGHKLRIGDAAMLEVTQLGKRCHGRCRIFEKLGNCIMPRQGVFARVVMGGRITVGDVIIADCGFGIADSARTNNPQSAIRNPQLTRVAILTVSDSCAQGTREDASGPAIREILLAGGYEIGDQGVVPDDRDAIARELIRFSDEAGCDLVFTTGGTGLGPRDVTPEATLSVCDRLVPGLGELMRTQGLKKTRNAVLSRGSAGLRGRTLIVNLPGSPRAVRECLEAILDILPHAIEMMHGGGHG
jgi:molybdenum cofactor synthesis domain-containing protein